MKVFAKRRDIRGSDNSSRSRWPLCGSSRLILDAGICFIFKIELIGIWLECKTLVSALSDVALPITISIDFA